MTHQRDKTKWSLRMCTLIAALAVTASPGDASAQCARAGGSAGSGAGRAMMGGAAMQGGRGGGGGAGATSMIAMLQMAQQMQAMQQQQQMAARAQQLHQLQTFQLQARDSEFLSESPSVVAQSGAKSLAPPQRKRAVKPRLTAEENRARLDRRRELLAESRARREASESTTPIVASLE